MGPDAEARAVLARLHAMANPDNAAGMARYGISAAGTLGVSMPALRGIAKEFRPTRRSDPESAHALAAALWVSGVHEARILAALIDVPELVTREQAEAWAAELDSWDVCDQLCSNLLDKTPFARELAEDWTGRQETFVKRAGFVIIAALAVHDKQAGDADFIKLLGLVDAASDDERNFVAKAANWAIRQIGKRNAALNGVAIATAEGMRDSGSRAKRRIATGALRELRSDAVRERLGL